VDLSRHEQDIEQMGDSVYMAPELLMTQKALNERVSFKSDVFSLGASMLQIASGMTLPQNGPLWHKLRTDH
jgi:serine/threonine protein kinase